MLKIGQKAPDFTLEDKDNNKHNLKETSTNYTIVYFYPKDNTPGCTIQAQEFTNNLNEFNKLNTIIFGISGGTNQTKEKFCNKYNLKVTLLTDPEFKTAEAYHSYGLKKFMGREYMGIKRNTFLLDKVSPKTHIQEILSDIKQLESDE